MPAKGAERIRSGGQATGQLVEPQSLRTCGSFNDGDSDDSRHVSPAIGVKSRRQVQGFGTAICGAGRHEGS
jgi:hypothetical protein